MRGTVKTVGRSPASSATYIFRSLGPDALSAVASGKAKLTDPGYVKAATEVAALGKNGYGGKAVGSIDYNTAQNEFVTGKAAMWYMGSWALSVFADPAQDKIGAANIGFMPFPAVTGGKGSIDQTPANVGIPLAFSSKSFGPKTDRLDEVHRGELRARGADQVVADHGLQGHPRGHRPAGR